MSECAASDKIASEPVEKPTTALPSVSAADAPIEPRATRSFSLIASPWRDRYRHARQASMQRTGLIAPKPIGTGMTAQRRLTDGWITEHARRCRRFLVVHLSETASQ